MKIVYASDDNYVEIMAVSICSLLENNIDSKNIEIYILSNRILESNKKKIIDMVCSYGRKIDFIDVKDIKQILDIDISHDRSLSMYSRLFISKILPYDIEKIIYLDCDSLVLNSLKNVYNKKLDDFYVAGVLDIVPQIYKKSINIFDEEYINSGFMLINLKRWREENIEQKFVDYIKKYNANVPHHDQGIINGVLHGGIKLLHPKYNVITPLYELDYKNLKSIYKMKKYYLKAEIEEAINSPVFAHLVSSFSGRPWEEKNIHPLSKEFFYYKKKTPWKSIALKKDSKNKNVKIMKFIYQRLPRAIFIQALKIILFKKNKKDAQLLNC